MMTKLINPFHYIAGAKSLVWGLLIILVTSVIGYYSHTHFPDVISVKTCPELPVFYFILQGLLNWFVPATLFYGVALLFSTSAVRAIDIYGTQAFARAPYLVASLMGFFGVLEKFGKHIMWSLLHYGEPVEISLLEMAGAIGIMVLTLLLTIWMITLMLHAFKVSANLKGGKLALIFIGVLIASMVITALLIGVLIKTL